MTLYHHNKLKENKIMINSRTNAGLLTVCYSALQLAAATTGRCQTEK